ncbi:bifunctional 3-(3-hydroxy-phenyl)propionate/3-hydroxycinnamic acid hydroxylase [Sphingomonas sp.]|uniref:bifunctional 3-(3-hydroxy-phenyl)propionate/3-hydroxycinnamic acid hydroxylase n=1 Tax=Sphingomonas sp. TaxID=28214 RepID=UPI003BAB5E95
MTGMNAGSYDVAIVGCGPVGALAANLLGRAGLRTVVVERDVAPYPLPRAVHVDHEMLRLFQSAGISDRIAPYLQAADGHLHVGADGNVIRYMAAHGGPKPFGWSNDYFFYQPELEQLLREGAASIPCVDLLLGTVFLALRQRQDRVELDIGGANGAATVSARWLIACDGAHSPVRKALGIRLDDLDFDEPWLVVDAEVEGPIRFPPVGGMPADANLQRLSVMLCDPRRPATLVPGRGNHRRWEFMLLPGERDCVMTRDETVRALLSPYLAGVPHRVIRAATYRFHALAAEHWQRGNIFLAGDAAHQTPPFFGQGMCHGMRDVANLAWKIAAIAKGEAGPAILVSYQIERDTHVRTVIGAAVEAGRYICELDAGRAAARDVRVRAAAHQRKGETAADLIPPLTGGLIARDTLGAGERFIQPLLANGRKLDDATGGGWRLFVRSDAVVRQPTHTPQIVADTLADGGAVMNWLGARGAGAALVRPDHYVFGTATGDGADLLKRRDRMMGKPLETMT